MHVGKRLRLGHTPLGISQEQLGAELSVTSQQVQRYERGHQEMLFPLSGFRSLLSRLTLLLGGFERGVLAALF